MSIVTIPSPKIVGARFPRPDENTVSDTSAPTSLQGRITPNIGRGNPAPTKSCRESCLKILPQNPEAIFIYEILEHHRAMGYIQHTSIQSKGR